MARRNEFLGIILGILLLIGLNILIPAIVVWSNGGILFSSASVAFFAVFGIGIFQLIYVIPLAIILSRRRSWGTMKGLIIGACLVALLNGGCWIFFIYP